MGSIEAVCLDDWGTNQYAGHSWRNYILQSRLILYALRYYMYFNSCSYLGIATHYCKSFTLALHPDRCIVINEVVKNF